MPRSSQHKHVLDNRANQLNPAHPAYYRSRGASPEAAADLAAHFQPALDNHANQLNPDAESYWRARGRSARDEATVPDTSEQTRSQSK